MIPRRKTATTTTTTSASSAAAAMPTTTTTTTDSSSSYGIAITTSTNNGNHPTRIIRYPTTTTAITTTITSNNNNKKKIGGRRRLVLLLLLRPVNIFMTFLGFIIYLRIFSSPPPPAAAPLLSSQLSLSEQHDINSSSTINSNHDRSIISPSSSSRSSISAINTTDSSDMTTTTTTTIQPPEEKSTSGGNTKKGDDDDDGDRSSKSSSIKKEESESKESVTNTKTDTSTTSPPPPPPLPPTTAAAKNTEAATSITTTTETANTTRVYKSPLELAEEEAAASKTVITHGSGSATVQPQPVVSSLLPWSNLTTLAYSRRMFYSGYRNQMQAFTMVVLYAIENGFGQVLVNSLQMKDTYGSNRNIAFQNLWDVEYWNSFYPQLPRLVVEDFKFHPNYDDNTRSQYINWMMMTTNQATNNQTSTAASAAAESNSTKDSIPIPDSPTFLHEPQHKLMPKYRQYSKGKGPYRLHDGKVGKKRGHFGEPHPADLLMQKVALRPNPELQKIMDGVIRQMHETAQQSLTSKASPRPPGGTESGSSSSSSNNNNRNDNNRYMTVHARVEPDMQEHPVCRDVKVLNLTDIVDFVEQGLINGQLRPVPKFIFMPLNRKLLERESRRHPENTIAKGNLKALDDVLQNGLLNGTIPVIHGYSSQLLTGTSFEYRPSTTQSALSYQIAIDAEIFIGTRVSSYSHALVTSRFYRDRQLPNFEYLPDGLQDWTPPELERPPPFLC